jgi:elongation factor P
MPTISSNDFKNGMTLEIEGVLWNVIEFQHVKPGKGHAFVRSKLKNARTGQVVEKTFRADEKVERAMIDKREMQYLYRDGSDIVFMDNESYDQMHVNPDSLGDAVNYLVESNNVVLLMHDAEIVGTDLPAAVELAIAETEPGIQGDRVSGARKPATLQTGKVVQVPLFVNVGDKVKVDTRTGDYITRV